MLGLVLLVLHDVVVWICRYFLLFGFVIVSLVLVYRYSSKCLAVKTALGI